MPLPYTPDSPDLPDDVKKWPKHAREIFCSTFAAVCKRNGNKPEGKAGNAYAVGKRAAQLWMKKKGIKFEDGAFIEGEPPMTEPREWAFFGPISLEQLKQEMPEWIPLHRFGEYYDPRYGHFSMTPEKALNAISNFYSCTKNPAAPVDAQVPIDTRHSGDGACGWLDAMTIHGKYLLGKPLWTPKGEEIVSNKLFRFVSPLYGEEGDDVLIKEVALTNRDFLKMPSLGQPIMLSADIEGPPILRPVVLEDSLDEQSSDVRNAFYNQFQRQQPETTEATYVKDVYEDYLINKKGRTFWKVPYKEDKDGNITFGDWQEVEIVYKPVKAGGKKMAQQQLETMTEEVWKALDDGMRLDIYYRLLDYEEIPDGLIALAKWTRAFINDLPNSAFAVVEPAYTAGKTDNKNARHLPHHGTDGKVDITHYRNALARANQIKPVTDSISVQELRQRAQRHLDGHKGVLKTSKEKQSEEIDMSEEMKLTVEQMEARIKELEAQGEKVTALEAQLETIKAADQAKTDRILELERARHEMLVEKHIKAAETRGIPPVIVNLVKPVMLAYSSEGERIIALEADAKANIFEMMVKLLAECPSRLGSVTLGPAGEPLPTGEGDQTYSAQEKKRLKELEEAEKKVRADAKRMGLLVREDSTGDN